MGGGLAGSPGSLRRVTDQDAVATADLARADSGEEKATRRRTRSLAADGGIEMGGGRPMGEGDEELEQE